MIETDVLLQCEWDVHYPEISGRTEYTNEEVNEKIRKRLEQSTPILK